MHEPKEDSHPNCRHVGADMHTQKGVYPCQYQLVFYFYAATQSTQQSRPTVRSFYHHEALSEGHQPPWLLFLGWYMYQRKIYFQKKKRRAVAPKIL